MKLEVLTITHGIIKYIVVEDTQTTPYIEFVSISVEEGHRKQGIGTKLIEELKKIAASKNIHEITVKAGTIGEDILGKFLLSNGFKPAKKTIYNLYV